MTTNDAVRALLAWLATYGLHSTLFLGGAWALCALRPPRANQNRERLWKLALVGGLVSATLQLAAGARPILGRIDWPPVAVAHRPVQAPLAGALAPEEQVPTPLASDLVERLEREATRPGASTNPIAREKGEPLTAQEDRGPAPAVASRLHRGPEAESESVAPASGGAPQPRAHPSAKTALFAPLAALSRSERWPGLVLGLWSACGLLGLAGLVCSWTCLRRRLLGRKLLTDGPLVALMDGLCDQAGVQRRVRLSVSPKIAAPFSTGLFRPEVCLPTAVLTTLSRAQQEALLAHELAHIVRRDPAWFGLGFLIEKLFFFQPLNRLARRRLSEIAEVACDDWAVRWTGARLALASCLTEVAGWVVGERPRLVTPPGLAGHRSRLGQRVARLLDDRRSPALERPARWWPPLAAGALAVAALAVPGVSAEEAERDSTGSEPKREPERAPASATPAIRVEARPASAPASATTPAPATLGLLDERSVLEAELAMLESELRALHAELEARELSARFADALERIDARMVELRAQQARAQVLLARLSNPNTPADAPAPLAEALPPTANPGDSR
jgi:beta-lactamase regulating signal transducer with metallopeptidase domain